MTMPFFRSAAPSRVNTMTLPALSVMMSLIDRVLAWTESTIRGLAGIAHVDGVDPVAAEVGAEVRDLAVGMDPDLGGREGLPDHRARRPWPGGAPRAGRTVTGALAERPPSAAVTLYVPGS